MKLFKTAVLLIFFVLANLGQCLILQNVLNHAIEKLQVGRHHYLLQEFPVLQSRLRMHRREINECYDPSIGSGDHVDIFSVNIPSVVQKYFMSNQLSLHNSDRHVRKRVKNLIQNLRFVAKLVMECLEQEPGNRTRWGLTSMSAFSPEETFQIATHSIAPRGHHHKYKNRHPRCSLTPQTPAEFNLPPRFNWLDYGLYSPVRNQAESAWCAIFSSVSALEYSYQLKNTRKQKRSFSQKAIGACNTPGTWEGMYVEDIFSYVMKRGVTLYEDVPFDNKNSTCQHFPHFHDLRLKDYCFHYPDNALLTEQEMLLMVHRNGPSVVAINTKSNPKFHYFRSSRWHEQCDKQYDHAVLLVGWDEHDFLLQNSWGNWWGEKGFFRLPRGQNKCGIQTMIGSAIL